MVQLSHLHMTTGKAIALTTQTFVSKVMSLLFNTLSRFVIDFLPRSKCLNFMPAVTILSDFGAQENKMCHCCHSVPFYLPWSDGTRCHDLFSKCWVLSQLFHSSLSPSSRGCLVPLHFFAIRVVSSAHLRLLVFLQEALIPDCASSCLAFCVMYSA